MSFPLFKELLGTSYLLGMAAGFGDNSITFEMPIRYPRGGEATGDTELEVKNKKEFGSYLHIDGSES